MWRITPDQNLRHLSDNAPTVVWAPSEDIVFFRAELPERKQLWSQVISFALEEKLIHPVDTMHFAAGEPDGEKGVPVATLPLVTLSHWMELLKDHSVRPTAIYPDFMLLPFEEGQLTVWHENGRCLLRLSRQEGMGDSVEWIHTLLAQSKPEADLCVFSDDIKSLPDEWRQSAQSLPESLEDKMIKMQSRAPLPINLMAGDLNPISEILKWLKPWARAAAVVLALIPLYLTELHIKTRTLNAQTRFLNNKMENIVQECTSPQGAEYGNFSACMRRLVEKVQSDVMQTQESMWQAVKATDRILSSCKPCKVEKINLTKSRLLLEVSTSEDTKFATALKEDLSRWEVESESLADVGDRKQVRVTLSQKSEG